MISWDWIGLREEYPHKVIRVFLFLVEKWWESYRPCGCRPEYLDCVSTTDITAALDLSEQELEVARCFLEEHELVSIAQIEHLGIPGKCDVYQFLTVSRRDDPEYYGSGGSYCQEHDPREIERRSKEAAAKKASRDLLSQVPSAARSWTGGSRGQFLHSMGINQYHLNEKQLAWVREQLIEAGFTLSINGKRYDRRGPTPGIPSLSREGTLT